MIDEDTEAFNEIMCAFRLSKKTKKEQKEREKAILAATKNAINTPLLIMKKCNQLLDLIVRLIKYGNQNSFSDTAVAVELLYSSIKGAYYNVKINLRDIDDKKYIKEKKQESDNIISKSSKTYKSILEIIDKELL